MILKNIFFLDRYSYCKISQVLNLKKKGGGDTYLKVAVDKEKCFMFFEKIV